jgi:glycosyltransferase involved in cell wall biosynthesis
VERDVTLVVKTFERPEAVSRLAASVRRFYPELAIYLVDDSAEPLDPLPEGITRYWHLPFNVGASYGRNFGLAQVETDYVAYTDDDLVFTEKTDLRKLLHVLTTTPFDVVSCAYVDYAHGDPFVRWFEGTVEIEDGVLTHCHGGIRGYLAGHPIYDVLHSFFLARRAPLGEAPWDEGLKLGAEHLDFYLGLKERGVLCTRLANVAIDHRPMTSARYAPFRADVDYEQFHRKLGIVGERVVARSFDRRALARHRLRRATSAVSFAARRAADRVAGSRR